MLRTIDRSDTHTIQKVSNLHKNTVHYQTIETALIGKGAQATAHTSLREARQHISRTISHPVNETAGAKSYSEQQKGYSR